MHPLKKKYFVIGLIGISVAGLLLSIAAFMKIYRYHFSEQGQHPPFRADLSDLFDQTLSHYYVHTDGQKVQAVQSGLYSEPPFDRHGIPLVDYGKETGVQYNPTTIAQFGLDNYELFLQTGDKNALDAFFKQADWLVENQNAGKWFYRFDHRACSMKKPWISAMSQGQGISLLLRAYQQSGESLYLDAAKSAFEVFKIPLKRGGVSAFYEYGMWFEEYPNAESPSHVLNGHIWALFGLWDLYRETENSEVLDYFNDGIRALRHDLKRYDTGYWVLYDQTSRHFLVDRLYMDFQIDQMRVLYAITKNPVFDQYLNQWDGYRHDKSHFISILWPSLLRQIKLKLNL